MLTSFLFSAILLAPILTTTNKVVGTMKKTLLTLSAVAVLSGVGMVANAESSMAATSGAYITAGMGYVSNNVSDKQAAAFVAGTKANSTGLYSKLGMGYDFNSMFGLEGDWYHLPSISVSTSTGANRTMMYTSANKLALIGKIMYPVSDSVKLVGGAGIAYAMYKTGDTAVSQINTGSKTAKANSDYSRILPMIQGGVEYSASKNIGLNLNVNYTFKGGQIPSSIGADVGVSYHF